MQAVTAKMHCGKACLVALVAWGTICTAAGPTSDYMHHLGMQLCVLCAVWSLAVPIHIRVYSLGAT